jgi:methionyl-tRNA formyltransferase
MRFAVTLTDRYLGVLQALVGSGWTPLKIFTMPVDNRLHHNTAVLEYARKLQLEVQISRLTADNLSQLSRQGCETLVVASYQWRIADWRPHLRYAVNFHPAPLPRGRGPYPTPVPILERSSTWGMSCHRLEHEFDSGDVLSTIEFPVAADDDHDSVDLKLQFAARRLATEVAGDFPGLWDRAVPQVGGSYYPLWTDQDRTLDFGQPVESILRRVRAFGPIECLAQLNGATLFVRRAVGWQEAHALTPGTMAYVNGLSLVIAVLDGYVGLTEWSLVKADSVTGTARR